MKNKGFTLVELLAVIVVLAIIAVITVPMILGIVERARKGALKDSAYGLIEAGNIFYAQKSTQVSETNELKFTMTNGKFILNGTEEELKFKGAKPTMGNLTITPTQSAIRITDGVYCAYKSIDDLSVNVIKGNCNTVNEEGEAEEEQKLSNVYPVGAIYMSVDNTNPANLFGGTWEKIKDTFLLSSGDTYTSGSTGGEATHTLTVDEMPAHSHSVTVTGGNHRHTQTYSATPTAAGGSFLADDGASGTAYNAAKATAYSGNLTMSGTAAAVGSGTAHNNMPPYLVVNVWKRTA